MPEPRLAVLLAGALATALNAYVLTGGADFGGGVWDLLATGPRQARQRELIAHAIGPIWEANHVWLILAVVLLFTCFPPAFARLAVTLHIPLTLMLFGIVLRGSAFAFRAYDRAHDRVQRRWGRVFAIASTVTPLMLGICVGAVASGRAGAPPGGGFANVYVFSWLTPFGTAVGILALALFAFLAAVYLTIEAADEDLREDFRRRGIVAGLAVLPAAALVLALSRSAARPLGRELMVSAWSPFLHGATAAAAIAALAALWGRNYRLARVAAAAQVSLILWGWVTAQYPLILPPDLDIGRAAAPPDTLRFVVVGLVAGVAVLAPSLAWLFRVFRAGRSSGEPVSRA